MSKQKPAINTLHFSWPQNVCCFRFNHESAKLINISCGQQVSDVVYNKQTTVNKIKLTTRSL
jgi:hypothetical protein